jgi:hypothetical protein
MRKRRSRRRRRRRRRRKRKRRRRRRSRVHIGQVLVLNTPPTRNPSSCCSVLMSSRKRRIMGVGMTYPMLSAPARF